MIRSIITVTLLALAGSAIAQQPLSPQLSLFLLVEAQVDSDNQDNLLLTVGTYEATRQTIVHPATRLRLDGSDGTRLLLKYDRVRSATVERDAIVVIQPTGTKKLTASIDQFRFYKLDGNKLRPDEVVGALAKPQAMFLLDDTDSGPPKVSEVIREALKEDCLIAITNQRIREIDTDTLPDSIPEPQPELPQN